MPDRPGPNILVIMSDQHNRGVAGCYGDAVIRTPSLDGLARRGVVFDSAYCDFPLCCPARMSFMTGLEPREIEMWLNGDVLPSDVPTFAHALGRAGYETVLCGRMHFNGPDQRHGFARRVFPEVGGRSAGQLVGANQFNRTSMEKSGPGRNHYLLYDEQCAAAAVEWLGRRAVAGAGRKPFCLVVGLVGPHCPFVCPPELFEHYFDAVSVPMLAREEQAALHPYSRRYRRRSGIEDLTEHEVRRTRAAYYGMIEFDDRLVGRVLEALAAGGLAEETAVIYTSDHGDLAGEHGMWWKMSFYEGSAGVPLIASWPGRFPAGVRLAAPVTLADLAPTLAELGGAGAMPGVTRRGLARMLRSGRDEGDRAAFCELIGDSCRLPQGPAGRPARMIRRGQWKCNVYLGEPPELFNLADDPGERVNRAADPACRAVLDRLRAEVLAGWDAEAIEARAAERRGLREYLRAAPADPTVLAGDYWSGPEDYGTVDPV